MQIDLMKGSRRGILMAALVGFEKATKEAGKKCEAAFLPDMESGIQLERISEAKEIVPAVDDVGREWEATEPSDELLEEIQVILQDLGDQRDLFAVLELVFMYRNSLVAHAREVDKVKEKEKKIGILTTEMERNGEAVENKPDPRQLDLAPADGDDGKKQSFSDILKAGRANATGAKKENVGRSARVKRKR
jgi:hypothetical protein